ncbi:MAG: rRNA maturation RNase YbeY [Candidatus Omnitrophota bacterium]|nr:rRNA maturation RNase YbeY [Candidatus Omnitrophota bacterium]
MRSNRVQGSGFRVQVRIVNLNKAYKVNEPLVRKISRYILAACGKASGAELELVFLDNKRIKPLNKKFKDEDRPTDVLSFDLGGGLHRFFGNIFISIDRARENSKIFNTTLEEELTLYMIHGILHLTGYDDETKKERARMDDRQKTLLGELCARENLSKVLTPR